MKKRTKVVLSLFAVITVITVIISIVMLKAVSGDNLFYINSTFGHICAVSYRWVCFAGVMFTAVWILLIVKKGRKIANKLLEFVFGKDEASEAAAQVAVEEGEIPEVAAASEEAETSCPDCDKNILLDKEDGKEEEKKEDQKEIKDSENL